MLFSSGNFLLLSIKFMCHLCAFIKDHLINVIHDEGFLMFLMNDRKGEVP